MSKRLFFTLVCLLGCGDDDGGGSGDAGGGSTAAMTCARGCARAAAANCPSQPTDCTQRCEAEISRTPTVCLSAVSAYATCATSAVFSCDNTGVAQAASCQPQLAAWLSCANGGVVPDGGQPMGTPPDASAPVDTGTPDAGTPGGEVDTGVPDAGPVGLSCTPAATDVECDLCIKERCCETLSACSGDCINLLSCSNACQDADCGNQCRVRYANGLPGVQNVANCMARSCADECEMELSQ